MNANENKTLELKNFIRTIIDQDLATGKHAGRVATRFPPEPNGYLHVGHAKSICLNFGIAGDYAGATCNLRFDDTNPSKEEVEYAEAIKADVRWLGFDWHELRNASDYFDQLFDFAVQLIKLGKAYVCDLSPEQVKEYRGTLTSPGRESPGRQRSMDENLDLFQRMKAGEFPEGKYVLRAKIDMASGNINMRDPTIYRIMKKAHHQTGDKWCIYPMYDYTHCISDSLENITHSLCTLEFQDHRPLYDWFLDVLGCPNRPQQIEFARLNLNYTVTSKRKLKRMVDEKLVSGWDDPRMSTICGMRRRGYTAAAIRTFCDLIGITKKETVIDLSYLEECVRNDLNEKAPRAFCVLDPLKLTITNVETGYREMLEAQNHPQKPDLGKRGLAFTQELWIEREDFSETPVPGFQRLVLGGEVRLRYAYVLRCDDVIKDSAGRITELRCTIDKNTLGKNPEGRKVKGVIHWLSTTDARSAAVRIYDRLFKDAAPEADGRDFLECMNPDSLQTITGAKIEGFLADQPVETTFQFERLGYFVVDKDSTPATPVFNRTVSLRDTWKV